MITDAKQTEEIVASGKAGFGAIAHAILYDPRSRRHAAVLARAHGHAGLFGRIVYGAR